MVQRNKTERNKAKTIPPKLNSKKSTKSTKTPKKNTSRPRTSTGTPKKQEGEPSNEKIIQAIHQTFGRISVVARYLKIDRTTIYQRIEKHPKLREAVIESRKMIVPFAESKLMQNVAAGDQRAIEFVLKNKGKGWDKSAGEEGVKDLSIVIQLFEESLQKSKLALEEEQGKVIEVQAKKVE